LYAVGSVHGRAFLSIVTQKPETRNNAREVILVNENIEVSWLARAEQACVAVKVIIILYWAHDISVDDRARAAVSFLVTVKRRLREEDHFVLLGNNNKSDRGIEIKASACVCRLAVVGRRGTSLGVQTRGKGERDGLRMNLSSLSRTSLNSPSETPSWETFVLFGHDIEQKPGITDRDRIRCAWETCPSIP
jgi:hypothetical protein